MHRQVPLARRNVLADPRRLAASTAGVGLSLMLILLLSGLWAGVEAKTTVYEDNSGADLFVAQAGTRNFFSSVSVVPVGLADTLRKDPAVSWAAPVRGMFSVVELHDRKVPAYVVGFEPGRQGGPWKVIDGRAPRASDEITIGQVFRQRHGLDVGDTLKVLGRRFRVVGIADADMFMTSFVFMTRRASDALLRSPKTTSFVLVSTDKPDAVRQRVQDLGYVALDRDQLKTNDLAVLARPFSVPIRVMVAVAFAVGSLVIALTAYSAIVDRSREYGIIRALGAGRPRLYRLAVTQTLVLAGLGFLAGGVMFGVGREVLGAVRPQFQIVLTPQIVLRTGLVALVMGLLAAVIPARRLARLDPAEAYRGA